MKLNEMSVEIHNRQARIKLITDGREKTRRGEVTAR
jgi:hypothetical protein